MEEGELIAKCTGMTGYTSAPHLHFHVFKDSNNKKGFKFLKISWKNNPVKVYKKASKEIIKPEYKPLLDNLLENYST